VVHTSTLPLGISFERREDESSGRRSFSYSRTGRKRLRSVREQMRYDVARIVVEAGKPFQIIYKNSDRWRTT
jgi:hypothetical protein